MKPYSKIFIGVSLAISTMNITFAQETSNSATDQQANEKDVEVIRVTGSRIVRKDYASSSPVVTVSAEQMDGFGAVTVEESLNVLPQFVEGGNAGTVSIGGGGGATLNMRALGTNRNLILLDQHRLPISSPFGSVDTNVIPTIMLRGVEVLTGGASSVYGSEAISGVVNFQSSDYFDGVKFSLEYGDSQAGGTEKDDMSILVGARSDDDKGRLLFAMARNDRSELRGEDRDFFNYAIGSSFIGQGTYRAGGNDPSQAAVNSLFQNYGINQTVSTDRLGFNDDGSLFSQLGGALNYVGPDGEDSLYWVKNGSEVRQPVGRQGTALKGLKRYNTFVKGEYDLSDEITAYGQFLFSDSVTSGSASRNLTLFGPTATIPVSNPFIPDDLTTLLASRTDPTADFILNQRFLGIDERTHQESFKTTQYIVGLKGYLGYEDWTFDLYAARDSVTSNEEIQNIVLGSRINQLLHASDGGDSLCQGGYNPFGLANATNISEECQQFMAPDVTSTLSTTRRHYEGVISGTLFELPAGFVQFSATASYRTDSLNFNPSLSVQTNDALGVGQSLPTSGETNTTEFGGELLVPLVDGETLIESLDLTAGFRSSNQDVTGNGNSWNVGLEWRPSETTFVRTSLQHALRAPNIGELYSASLGSEVTVGDPGDDANLGDPCDIRNAGRLGVNNSQIEALCLSQGLPLAQIDSFEHTTTSLPTSTGGNTELTPEKAKTVTVGLVWQPQLSDQDLSVSIDYWSIKIDDVISTINGRDVINRCFDPTFNATFSTDNEFCQLISRESATGTVSEISTTYLNLASIETSGIDIQLNHAIDLGAGKLRTNIAVGWLNEYQEQSLPDEDYLDFAGTIGGPANRAADNDIHPELTIAISPTYQWGALSTSLRWRYIDSMDAKSTITNIGSTTPSVPSMSYFDLSTSYDIYDDGSLLLKASISNLFDKQPPEVDGQIGQTRLGTYDVIGRAFTVGLQGSF